MSLGERYRRGGTLITDPHYEGSVYTAGGTLISQTPARPASPGPPQPVAPSPIRRPFNVEEITPDTFRRITDGYHPGGTSPILVLEIDGRGWIVLKADASVENEFHTSQLFTGSACRGMVPKMRLLEKGSYREIIRGYGDRFDFSKRSAKGSSVFSEMGKSPSTFLVIEYLNEAKTADEIGNGLLEGPKGRPRLFALGMIAAYDLVIHNNDRFPGVITNSFNAGNLMFQEESVTYEIDRPGLDRSPAKTHTSTVTRPVAIDNNLAQLTPQDREGFRRKGVQSNALEEAYTLVDVVNDQATALEIAREMGRRLNLGNLEYGARVIADGIREGLLELSTGDQKAVKSLVQTFVGIDFTRMSLVIESAQVLKNKCQQIRDWDLLATR